MKAGFLKLIFALAISSWPLHAVLAQTTPDTPETVAKAYMDATRAGDWAKCARLMHPEALKQIRGLLEPIVLTVKTEKDRQEIESLLGVRDKASFDKLGDEELFAKFFTLVTTLSSEIKKMLGASKFEIIGQVSEAPDLIHILYRMQLSLEMPELKAPIQFAQLEVMSLRRFENSWRADLKGDLKGIIQAIAAGIASAVEEKEKSEPAGAGKPERKP